MLCLIRSPNGITGRAREVLALLCNPVGTQRAARIRARSVAVFACNPYSSSPRPCPCGRTRAPPGPVFDWLSASGGGRGLRGRPCAALGTQDLISNYTPGRAGRFISEESPAIMRGLAVSVAAKLTPSLLPLFAVRVASYRRVFWISI